MLTTLTETQVALCYCLTCNPPQLVLLLEPITTTIAKRGLKQKSLRANGTISSQSGDEKNEKEKVREKLDAKEDSVTKSKHPHDQVARKRKLKKGVERIQGDRRGSNDGEKKDGRR